jgi:putative endonuclease
VSCPAQSKTLVSQTEPDAPSKAEKQARRTPKKASQSSPWFLYLIECIDGSIYTGITVDVAARYAAHASGQGARYTRAHPPARLLASFSYPDRSSASKAEYRIKQLKPADKRRFAANPEHLAARDDASAA